MLLSTKFQVIAATVATVCAAPKPSAMTLSANCSVAMWIAMPVRPTRQNSRKRNDTASLVSFAMISATKSSATRVSSLLSPCWRSANTNGSSAMRNVPRAVAAMSSRILKPCVVSRGASSSKRVAPDHEEAAHRIAQGDAEQALRQRGREAACVFAARARQSGRRAAGHVAARDREIGVATQPVQHGGEQPLVMLQVGVHHGDVARLAGEHALDAGAGKAAPPDAADAAHAPVRLADRARGRRGAVGRVVVDENDLPVDAGERARELLHQQRNVVALLERRNDDAQLRAPGASRRPPARRALGKPHSSRG